MSINHVVPVVTIVVQGGKVTITDIYHDLEKKIPVVIIADTGRVADFYKRSLLYTKEFDNVTKKSDWKDVLGIDELEDLDPPHLNSNVQLNSQSNTTESTRITLKIPLEKLRERFSKYKAQLKRDLRDTLLINDSDEDLDELVKKVMFCLQPAVRSNIIVFNLNSDSNLSETIFQIICRSRQKSFQEKQNQQKEILDRNHRQIKPLLTPKMRQLHLESHHSIHKQDENTGLCQLLNLAMDWNCIDAAKELVLKNSLDCIQNEEKVFQDALTNNLPAFVYEFIKLGINLDKIFFPGNSFANNRYKIFLKMLYTENAVNSDQTHLRFFIPGDVNQHQKQILSCDTLNDIFRKLVGDYMYKLYFDSQKAENEHRLRHGLIEKINEDNEIANKQQNDKKLTPNDYIMRDLFLWSILMNYVDMAKILLSHMKYRICPALIATKIFKQYHHKAPYGDLKDSYMESAKYFEQYAIDCLDKCDDHNVDLASEIILQQNELYGYVTCLQVASDAQDKRFIAQPCCAQTMRNIWYNKIRSEKSTNNKFYIMLGIITFGLLAPPVVRFRTGEEGLREEAVKQNLQPHGIDYSDTYNFEYARYQQCFPIKKYLNQFISFHKALCVKCAYHILHYIFFLLLFSFVLLFEFKRPTNQIPSIHWTEILTIILVLCMLIEEIVYFFSSDSVSLIGKIQSYFRDFFKWLTTLGFVLFIVGFILRFSYADSEEDFTAARIVMAFAVEIWWLRCLSFVILIPYLGPHLVAIAKMLKDLLFFICIIVIVIAGYGVASRSMVYYPKANNFTTETGGFIDTSLDGRTIFYQIVYPVYYFIHGQIDEELKNLNTNRNAGWSIATHILLALHMLFVNILLINLLIAMFSKRFEQVYEDTHNIWHYQQYLFTREYYTRSPLFPPISVIYDLIHLFRMIFYFIRERCFNKKQDFKTKVFRMIAIDDALIKNWSKFEGASTYEYAHVQARIAAKSTTGIDLHQTMKKEELDSETNQPDYNFKKIQEDFKRLSVSIEHMKEELKKSIKHMKKKLKKSIKDIKKELQQETYTLEEN